MMAATPAIAAEVVSLGASNTEGKGRGATPMSVPCAQAFPAQLERMLQAGGCKARRQCWVADDTTRAMPARLPGAMCKDKKVVIV